MGIFEHRRATTLSALFALLVFWLTWANGGETPSARTIVLVTVVLIGVVCLFTRSRKLNGRTQFPPSTAIAVLVCTITWFQCIDLPRGLVRFLAPGSEEIHRTWVPVSILREAFDSSNVALSQAAADYLDRVTISIAPDMTRLALFCPLLFALVTWISFSMRWNLNAMRLLLVSMTVMGTLLSLFGLADALTLERDSHPELRARLWITPVGADTPFGTFVNSNNAGGFLHICISCAIGLVCLRKENSGGTARRGPWQYVLYSAIALQCCGVLGTQSRGAVAALFVCGLVTLMSFSNWRRRLRIAFLFGLIAIASFFLLQVIGTEETLVDRMKTMVDGRGMENIRIAHWQDSWETAKFFFPMGAGLGAYRFAYLPFQKDGSNEWYVNADGMYVEWLVEGGAWLLSCVFIGLVYLLRSLRFLELKPTSSNDPIRKSELCLGESARRIMIYLIPAMLVTQGFDFGILLPSLLLPIALLVGMVESLASQRNCDCQHASVGGKRVKERLYPEIIACFFVGLLALLSAQTLVCFYSTTWLKQIDSASSKNRRSPVMNWSSFEPDLQQLKDSIEGGVLAGNSDSHRVLSNLRIRHQQWIGLQYLLGQHQTNPLTDVTTKPEMLSVAVLRRAIKSNLSQGAIQEPSELMLEGQDLDEFVKARQNAIFALLLSPLDYRPRIRLIETDFCSAKASKATAALIGQLRELRLGDNKINSYLNYLENTGGQ